MVTGGIVAVSGQFKNWQFAAYAMYPSVKTVLPWGTPTGFCNAPPLRWLGGASFPGGLDGVKGTTSLTSGTFSQEGHLEEWSWRI